MYYYTIKTTFEYNGIHDCNCEFCEHRDLSGQSTEQFKGVAENDETALQMAKGAIVVIGDVQISEIVNQTILTRFYIPKGKYVFESA